MVHPLALNLCSKIAIESAITPTIGGCIRYSSYKLEFWGPRIV